MVTDEIRQCLAGMTLYYMEQIVDGIWNETIDVEIIDRVWDACEDLLRTPPDDEDRGSWLYRLERPWAGQMDPMEYIAWMGLDNDPTDRPEPLVKRYAPSEELE
jgi:hypothetical protein